MNAPPLYADPGYSTPFRSISPSNRGPSSVDPGVPPDLYYFIGILEIMASNHVKKWPGTTSATRFVTALHKKSFVLLQCELIRFPNISFGGHQPQCTAKCSIHTPPQQPPHSHKPSAYPDHTCQFTLSHQSFASF